MKSRRLEIGQRCAAVLEESGISVLNGAYASPKSIFARAAEYGLEDYAVRNGLMKAATADSSNPDTRLIRLRLYGNWRDPWTTCLWRAVSALGNETYSHLSYVLVPSSPRAAVREEQQRHRLFSKLSAGFRKEIYAMMAFEGCILSDAFRDLYNGREKGVKAEDLELDREKRGMIGRIISKLGDDYLSLALLFSNMVGSVEIMERQRRYLLGVDAGRVPAGKWREAKLKPKVARAKLENIAAEAKKAEVMPKQNYHRESIPLGGKRFIYDDI